MNVKEKLAKIRGVSSVAFLPVERPDPLPEFLQHLRDRRYVPRVVASYGYDLRRCQRFTKKPLLACAAVDVDAYMASLARGGLSAGTICKRQASLRGFFKWAMRQEPPLVSMDPCRNFLKPHGAKKLPRYLVGNERGDLLAAVTGDTPLRLRDAAIVATLLLTGMRAGELSGLTIKDFRRKEGRVKVWGKGSKEREIPIPRALGPYIDAWLAVHPDPQPDSPFICHLHGYFGKMPYDTLRRVFARVLNRAGLAGTGLSCHKLRHSYATELIRKRVPIDQLRMILGHESIATTQKYAHSELDAQTLEALDGL